MSAGPGEITSLNFNGGAPTVTGNFVDGWGLTPAPDTYDSAAGITVERGSIMKTASASIYDYSAFSTLDTLMTGRTQHDLVVTYINGDTQTLADGIVTVVPLSNVVTDVLKVLIGASAATDNNLDAETSWTDLGKTMGDPANTYSMAFQGSDGLGRPYFSSVGFQGEIILPDATYSDLDSFVRTKCKVALKLVDGNYQVYDNVYVFRHYKAEDGSGPRGVRLVMRAVEDAWSDILTYHDGSSGSATPGDYFAGCVVTWTGFKYSEGDLSAFA